MFKNPEAGRELRRDPSLPPGSRDPSSLGVHDVDLRDGFPEAQPRSLRTKDDREGHDRPVKVAREPRSVTVFSKGVAKTCLRPCLKMYSIFNNMYESI